MNNRLNLNRIPIFLAFTFGIAWSGALIVYLTGGLENSPEIAPGLSLALVLEATLIMWAPGLAHLFTRLVTGEDWRGLYLAPRLNKGWPYWLAAWLLPPVFIILGAAVYFLVFPQHYDPTLATIRTQLETSGQIAGFNLWTLVFVQGIGSLLLAPLVNGLFVLGEELGWRAYLLPKLLPLGGRKAFLLVGLIWGVWHWPMIAMGFNYGLGYWGWPWLGMLAMTWSCVVSSYFMAWLTLRSGSLWPAVIAHAVTNGVAGIALVCAQGEPYLLLGPLPSGIIASAGWTLAAFCIFILWPRLHRSKNE